MTVYVKNLIINSGEDFSQNLNLLSADGSGVVDLSGFTIASQTPLQDKSILEESTSCRSENPKEQSVELQASQTGRSTTEALRILSKILEEMARILSEEKSSPSIQPSEK